MLFRSEYPSGSVNVAVAEVAPDGDGIRTVIASCQYVVGEPSVAVPLLAVSTTTPGGIGCGAAKVTTTPVTDPPETVTGGPACAKYPVASAVTDQSPSYTVKENEPSTADVSYAQLQEPPSHA